MNLENNVRLLGTTTDNIICIPNQPLDTSQVHVKLNPLQDLPTELKQDQERYFSGDDALHLIPGWREQTFVLPTPFSTDLRLQLSEQGTLELELTGTTSYHNQAVRANLIKDITPIAVQGLLMTSDKYLLHGVRGGQFKPGFVHAVPAGVLTDSLFQGFYSELLNETGLPKEDVSKPKIVGWFLNPYLPNLNFVFYTETTKTLEELQKIHGFAYGIYQKAKILGGDNEEIARQAIIEAKCPNIDAWEHNELLGIKTKSKQLTRTINSKYVITDPRHNLLPQAIAGLEIYLEIAQQHN